MILRIPRIGLVLLLAFWVFALGLMLYLVPRLGGPRVIPSDPYTVRVTVADAHTLGPNNVVQVRGVEVGKVRRTEIGRGRAQVELEIEERFAPIHRDARVRVAQRTAAGDAWVDLQRGTRGAGTLPDGGTIRRTAETTEFDEFFSTFDEPARRDLVSLTRTFARGARPVESAQRWGETVHQLSRATHELRGLTDVLRGQEDDIAQLVRGSRVVLGELGARERALTALVADGRRTLRAFSEQPRSFAGGLQALPRFAASARRALAVAHPLLAELRPFVADVRAAAPDLRATFRDARPFAAHTRSVIDRLPSFNRTALPFLRQARPTIAAARPFARQLEPTLANLVPIARYLAPRGKDLVSWYTGTLASSLSGDSKGPWVRFFIFAEPGTATGLKAGAFSKNPYPRPGHAADPKPHDGRPFERLLPYTPQRR